MAPGHMPGAQTAPVALLHLQQVGAFVGILLSSPLPQVDRATAEARDTGQGAAGSKRLLTCLQQLCSMSSVQPGQGSRHRGVSEPGSRYPRAQEGGRVPEDSPTLTLQG